jgi:pyridoxal phosphate enzyme (YggS family)
VAVSLDAAQIAQRLAHVQANIERACARAGRAPKTVRLIAVSKGQPAAAVRAAYAAGQREFGENYVQELTGKARELADLADLRWRFIGHLQRNKAKDLVKVGCSIDSVDSIALAEAISQRASSAGCRIDVLLEVNVDREPQKAGVLPEAAAALAAHVRALPGLVLRGLMTIPRAGDDPETARPTFRALRALAAELGVPDVSMGMSADAEVAIEEGATMVRVGTAIFGARAKPGL